MSTFVWSQVLIAVAIVFDLASFQFKQRQKILGCLFLAGLLIAGHFVLLQQWTAAALMLLASIRYLSSIFSTSKRLMRLFLTASLLITTVTFSGLLSLLSFTGSLFQTTAAFSNNDQKLRQLMLLGTTLWLLHNTLAGSPAAVVMELVFITSNLIGYYRY